MTHLFFVVTQIDCFNVEYSSAYPKFTLVIDLFFVFRYYGASSSISGKQNLKKLIRGVVQAP